MTSKRSTNDTRYRDSNTVKQTVSTDTSKNTTRVYPGGEQTTLVGKSQNRTGGGLTRASPLSPKWPPDKDFLFHTGRCVPEDMWASSYVLNKIPAMLRTHDAGIKYHSSNSDNNAEQALILAKWDLEVFQSELRAQDANLHDLLKKASETRETLPGASADLSAAKSFDLGVRAYVMSTANGIYRGIENWADPERAEKSTGRGWLRSHWHWEDRDSGRWG